MYSGTIRPVEIFEDQNDPIFRMNELKKMTLICRQSLRSQKTLKIFIYTRNNLSYLCSKDEH